MLFNSIDFLLFFPIVTILYFLLPHRVRWVWLLCASYYFYMCWNAKYALLIALSTVITYFSGLLIEGLARQKKLWVALSFLSNLAILFFFKYFDFFLNNLSALCGLLGVTFKQPAFDIVLPVGISFYTFQALSYTMDVYRGEQEASGESTNDRRWKRSGTCSSTRCSSRSSPNWWRDLSSDPKTCCTR